MTEASTMAPPAMPPEQIRIVEALAAFPLRRLLVLQHAETGEPRTAGQQADDLVARQGNHVVLHAGRHAIDLITGASKHALVLGGVLAETPTKNRMNQPATAFSLTEDGWHYAVPAAAAFSDWDFRFPFLLRELLGEGRFKHGAGRPVVLLGAYEQLAAHPAAYSEILKRSGCDRSKLYKALDDQVDKGTLLVNIKAVPANRRILISPHDTPRRQSHNEAGQAAYNTSRTLRARGILEVTGQEFLDEVIRLYPRLNPDTVWKIITKNSHTYLHFADQGDFGSTTRHKALYSIAPHLSAAIKDLSLRYQGLRDGNLNFTATARMLGKRMLGMPEVISYLIAKDQPRTNTQDGPPAGYIGARQAMRAFVPLTRGTPDWRNFAACRTMDTELFFPVGKIGPSAEQAAAAKKVCGACVVRFECLDWATASGQAHGIFGGKTPEERRTTTRPAFKLDVKTNNQITSTAQMQAQRSVG